MLSNTNHGKSKAAGQVRDTMSSCDNMPRTNESSSALEKSLASSVPLVTKIYQPGVLTKSSVLASHNPYVWWGGTTGRLWSEQPQGLVRRVGMAWCSCLFLGNEGG